MVYYDKYEYLQQDVFPLERQKKINCIMKKLNLFYYYGLIQKYECLQHDVFPLEQQEHFL